jgi:hypothetical protein
MTLAELLAERRTKIEAFERDATPSTTSLRQ